MNNSIIRVAVTGGAGQINYNLLFRIASGEMFGPHQKVALNILELPVAMKAMEGVAMELEDCAFPLLNDIILTDDVNTAMKNVNWALLVGAKPRGPGMERNDLITENGPIFTSTGKAINNNAASDVRIVVVGNPCNTNCLIAMHNAPDVPKNRWHAMTRLDQNRALTQLSKKSNTPVADIKNLAIWGNHSSTMVVDYINAKIGNKALTEVITDTEWLKGEFYNTVAQRGAAIISARGKSSAASAASACVDSVKSLTTPTPKGEIFSSAVYSNGNPYGIPEDLIFSFPCTSKGDGNFEIVDNFKLDSYLKEKMQHTVNELQKEKKLVENLLK